MSPGADAHLAAEMLSGLLLLLDEADAREDREACIALVKFLYGQLD